MWHDRPQRGKEEIKMSDLRYPVGKFVKPEKISEQDRRAYIQQIEEAPAKLRAAVKGLDDKKLDTPYREDGWTVRQVAHHLPDSHLNAYIRFKLALTENEPTIKPYDEKLWATLPDTKLPIEPSLQLFESLTQRFTALLKSMTPADFARTLKHPELGLVVLDNYTAMYAWHGRHHVAHITSMRERNHW
jgi:DinB family protein